MPVSRISKLASKSCPVIEAASHYGPQSAKSSFISDLVSLLCNIGQALQLEICVG